MPGAQRRGFADVLAHLRQGEDAFAFALRMRAPMGRWPAPEDKVVRFLRSGIPVPNVAFLKAMLSLPEEWWPRRKDDFYAAKHLATETEVLAEVLGHVDFLAGSKGRWDAYLLNLSGEPEPPFEDLGDVLDDVTHVMDMLRAFEVQVVLPALCRARIGSDYGTVWPRTTLASCVSARVLLGDKGLSGILDLSGAWHEVSATIETAVVSDAAAALVWPVPFPDLRAPNGLVLTWLPDVASLRAEGSKASLDGSLGLGHCVSSYAGVCLAGASSILSIRRADGTRLSTVEATLAPGEFQVEQHRGRGNAEPPPEAVTALEWLVSEHDAGRVSVLEAFAAHSWPTGSAGDGIPYDWSDDASYARAVRAWGRLLSRNLREPDAVTAAVVAEAMAVVRARVPGGEAGLEAGCILPATVAPWGAKPPAHQTPSWLTRGLAAFRGPSLASALFEVSYAPVAPLWPKLVSIACALVPAMVWLPAACLAYALLDEAAFGGIPARSVADPRILLAAFVALAIAWLASRLVRHQAVGLGRRRWRRLANQAPPGKRRPAAP